MAGVTFGNVLYNSLSTSCWHKLNSCSRLFYLCLFVFILYMINGREYSSYQFAHNIGPSVLTYSSAGLLRLSQNDIPQITAVVADFIQPISIPGTQLSSLSSSNPLQVLGSLLSSEGSSSSLVPTPAFFDNVSITPMY